MNMIMISGKHIMGVGQIKNVQWMQYAWYLIVLWNIPVIESYDTMGAMAALAASLQTSMRVDIQDKLGVIEETRKL